MNDGETTLGGLASRVQFTLGLAGAAALAAGLALGWSRGDGLRYFLHSYLLNYCYVLSIALGRSSSSPCTTPPAPAGA